MFIIFGTRRTAKNFGSVGKNICSRCHNDVEMSIFCSTLWFTLFFLPIIPIKKDYYIGCPICNSGIEISKEQFKYFISSGKTIESDTGVYYNDELVKEDAKYAGKTKTQISYLKQIEEAEKRKAKSAN